MAANPLEEPLLWSGTAAPRPLSAARDGGMPSVAAELPGDTETEGAPSAWQDCLLSQCCRPGSRSPHTHGKLSGLAVCPAPGHAHPPAPGVAGTPSPVTPPQHHHTSVTRPPKEVEQPAPPQSVAALVPDSLLDFNSPQAQALAQVAGGMWVSQVLSKLWPQLSENIETTVREMMPQLVETNKPKWLEAVELDRFELGPYAPIVRGVHVDPVDDDHVGEVRLRLEVSWDSQSDVQLTVKLLPASLSKFLPSVLQNVANWVTSMTAGVQHLALRAQLLVTLGPLSSQGTIVQQAQVSLLRTPDIDFTITITKGESRVLNVVKPWLRSTIASAFASLVLPEHIAFPLAEGMPDIHKPEGLLEVRVVRATGVPKMDFFGHSDTYVNCWVRGRNKHRTPVIKKSADPEWESKDASFQFLVHTKQYQALSFELYDEDADTDDLIGGASIRLADLPAGQEQEMTLQVTNAGTAGPMSDDAPPGIDPAHSGGHSKVDVSNTRLTVLVRYLPARMIPSMAPDIGCPGTLVMKVIKVTVPDLAVLPLKLRPYVTGQQPPATPPISPPMHPQQGKDPQTGEELKERKDLPFAYDTVWDILGSTAEVSRGVFVLETVSDAGTSNELVVSRVEVPLSSIMARKLPAFPEGAGGKYTLKSSTGFQYEVELLWYPLLAAQSQAAAGAPQAAATKAGNPQSAAGVGLQALAQDNALSTTQPGQLPPTTVPGEPGLTLQVPASVGSMSPVPVAVAAAAAGARKEVPASQELAPAPVS